MQWRTIDNIFTWIQYQYLNFMCELNCVAIKNIPQAQIYILTPIIKLVCAQFSLLM